MKNYLLKLHLWLGLAAGLFLLAIGVSGSLLVFEPQIDRLLYPGLTHVLPGARTLSLRDLTMIIERNYAGAHVQGFTFAQANDEPYVAFVANSPTDGKAVAIDQYTGRVLGALPDNGFTRKLHGFHTHLLAGELGSSVVGWSSVVLAILGLSGLFLWWPRKTLGFSFQSAGAKFYFNAHNTIGICSSAVLLMFALTGASIHWDGLVGRIANSVAHVSPQRISKPAPPAPGATRLSADELIAIAQKTAPGALATRLDLPDEPLRPARVILKFPEDRTPIGRTRVFIDPYSGAVLSFTNTRSAPLPVQYASRVNRELHTGDVYGWPTRILAAVFSLALPVLAITGSLLWWVRRPARAARKASAAA